MVIATGNKVLASDVNTIIGKINTEATRRGVAAGLGTKSSGDKCLASDHDSWRTKNDDINAAHCYCEADGSIATHSGGNPLGLTAPNVSAGDKMLATHLTTLDTDIDNLAAQCACDGYTEISCSCDTETCGCEGDCCETNCDCDTNCSCNPNCTCNTVCGCNTYYCRFMCNNTVCDCQSYCNCQTNKDYNCTCDYNCGNNCSCNSYGCYLDGCSCDDVCSCEYGG